MSAVGPASSRRSTQEVVRLGVVFAGFGSCGFVAGGKHEHRATLLEELAFHLGPEIERAPIARGSFEDWETPRSKVKVPEGCSDSARRLPIRRRHPTINRARV